MLTIYIPHENKNNNSGCTSTNLTNLHEGKITSVDQRLMESQKSLLMLVFSLHMQLTPSRALLANTAGELLRKRCPAEGGDGGKSERTKNRDKAR